MKYAHVYALFPVFVFHTSCGQKQTNVPQENTGLGYSESPLKEATTKVPGIFVRILLSPPGPENQRASTPVYCRRKFLCSAGAAGIGYGSACKASQERRHRQAVHIFTR